ncbi:HepT-like ribonuclease domain-containing protein [Leptolyngbya sp. BC1307]|uniref:HepT-like ribonuclease domain-containing protein n=1 Tax=Leptolyngbya sp. BC1307 TaxID=2029589 RepID=UPI000EFC1137|nr:HepT-like ribonuclease domain-containing protein [Leptolyngbya sp. BC1307]
MSDPSLIHEKLIQIEEALQRVNRRFSSIKSPSDFLDNESGTDMLDAIGMMLIAIGENLKKIDYETDGELLKRYPSVNWRGAKGMRDILSHHYFDLDANEVFNICQTNIPELATVIRTMIDDIDEG